MTGQAVAQTNGTRPHASVAAGRKGFKAEVGDLRGRMCHLGLEHDEIAAEIGRRYRLRPRESYRLAWGWSLNHAAARFNALSAQQGTDPLARAGMTGPHLCEHEHWPDGGRKPSAFTLLTLAQLYQTDVLCLLDLADHENLAPQDRLTLIHRPQSGAARPFGERLVTLPDECAMSPHGVARRVPCSPAQLSNFVLGTKKGSQHLAGLLGRVLEVAGELAAMAETSTHEESCAASTSDMPDAPGEPSANVRGLLLSVPYVSGRLVIEISDPAANVSPVVAETDCAEPVGGQLALVQDLPD